MKITEIRAEKLALKLYEPIKVALGVIEEYETVIVRVSTDEGLVGYGESSPIEFVTGESVDTVLLMIRSLSKLLVGMNPLDIEAIHQVMDRFTTNNPAAKAGIDIALFDIKGKVMNQPLYKVLGGYSNKIETDITLSIDSPKEMARIAKDKVEKGFRIIKIKAGLNYESDMEAIRLIREAVGPEVKLRMDANQGWSLIESMKVMKLAEKYNIHAIEQPRPFWDIAGSAQIKNSANVNLMLDESVFSPYDAMEVIRNQATNIINIKLMKSGGIHRAEQINAVAQAAGMNCMVGCMLESRIAISAGAHFAAAKMNIPDVDLDGFMFCHEHKEISGGFTMEGPTMTLLDRPGLGLDINI